MDEGKISREGSRVSGNRNFFRLLRFEIRRDEVGFSTPAGSFAKGDYSVSSEGRKDVDSRISGQAGYQKGSGGAHGRRERRRDHYAVAVKPGRMLFEVDGLAEEAARDALRKAAAKLPLKTKIVKR